MKTMIILITLFAFPWVASAKNYNHSYYGNKNHGFWKQIDQRQYKMQRRIDRGIDSGQLTRREVKKLRHSKARLKQQINQFRDKRFLSYSEKRCVIDYLDDYSEKIHHLKNNDRYARHRNQYEDDYYPRSDYNHRHYNNRRYGWANRDNSAGFYVRF